MQLLNNRKYGFLLVILLSVGVIITSCGDDDPDPEPETCVTTGLTYDNFAKDFLVTNCATIGGCHLEDQKDNLVVGSFVTYEEAKIVVDRGRIKGAINHLDGFFDMPKGETMLDSCSIAKLSAWVDAGAPE